MLYSAILILILSTTSTLVSSLQCYSCKPDITVNYIVTSDTIPSFPKCELVNDTVCTMAVIWDQINNHTTIKVGLFNTLSMKDTPSNLAGMVVMRNLEGEDTLSLTHNLYFSSNSSDKSNNETTLKIILRSIIIEDQFRQELAPLIKVVPAFDPKSAECFKFYNTSNSCAPIDLNNCKRCSISVDKKFSMTEEVCATCPQFTFDFNSIIRSTFFTLNTNRTELVDDIVELDCQLKTCNTIANVNQIFKASKITFNADEFFKNSL